MSDTRYGRQTPTKTFILPYEKTLGNHAVELYESSGRKAQEWQKLMAYDILAINEDDLFVHTKFGYSIPRRNGKGEVLTIVELEALHQGLKALHTAHRTTTSSSASKRLAKLLKDSGYTEVLRVKKETDYEKSYVYAKQYGLERITLLDTGGTVEFRTRTSSGGLGEGFDVLIIDEAQEYNHEQESTLKYTVSDSHNPITILCGTPPTEVSTGDVFEKMRYKALFGELKNTGWAEWSVDEESDVNDIELWYQCNPAMGYQLNERKIGDELGEDKLDFNIQRLGYWTRYSQKSAISDYDWKSCQLNGDVTFKGKLFVGVKFGRDDTNVSVSIAVKTSDQKVYVEVIDCREIRNGFQWIIELLRDFDYQKVVIDGANYQDSLVSLMKNAKLKGWIKPTVKEVIESNSAFTQALYSKNLYHNNQPSLKAVVTHCSKRPIGSNGGYGYKCDIDSLDISLLDSTILAYWLCSTSKDEVKKQRVIY